MGSWCSLAGGIECTLIYAHTKKSSHHQCTQKNSEGACGKMLHSTACVVFVCGIPALKSNRSSLNTSRKPHASSILREMASHTPAADCYFNFLWSASHGYMEKNTHHSHLYGFDEKYALKKKHDFWKLLLPN